MSTQQMLKRQIDTAKLLPGNTGLSPIWKMYPALKCPLIGTCLSISEQRRILKKTGLSVKREKDHEIHKMVMEKLGRENKVSSRIDRFIRHKHRKDIAKYIAHSEEHLKTAWQNNLLTGEIEGLFYVIASRADISEDFLREVHGELHMMGHRNVVDTIQSRRSLYVELEVNHKLASLLNKEKNRIKKLMEKNKELAACIEKSRAQQHPEPKKVSLPIPDARIKQLNTQNLNLKDQVAELKAHRCETSKKLHALEREKRKLQIKLFDIQATHNVLAEEVNNLISQLTATLNCKKGCDVSCPDYRLCAKRILIVGGMTKMKQFYRNLIESGGGEFDYHDGYMKGGNKGIEDRILKSDYILCPVNCNSHNACDRVKKLCKKHNKPIKILANSSLSSISSALIENFSVQN
ncbi:MAG: DUF2325 domain-containing protein [Pseudomonadota bacterium]